MGACTHVEPTPDHQPSDGGDTTTEDGRQHAARGRARRGRPPGQGRSTRGGRGRGRGRGTSATDTDLEEGLEIEADEAEEDPEEVGRESAEGAYEIGGVEWKLNEGRTFDPMDWNRQVLACSPGLQPWPAVCTGAEPAALWELPPRGC